MEDWKLEPGSGAAEAKDGSALAKDGSDSARQRLASPEIGTGEGQRWERDERGERASTNLKDIPTYVDVHVWFCFSAPSFFS